MGEPREKHWEPLVVDPFLEPEPNADGVEALEWTRSTGCSGRRVPLHVAVADDSSRRVAMPLREGERVKLWRWPASAGNGAWFEDMQSRRRWRVVIGRARLQGD